MTIARIKGKPCERQPNLFFSENPEDIEAAKSMCRGCPVEVLTACFRQGLGADIIAHRNNVSPGFGVYAGMTPEERQPYLKRWLKRQIKDYTGRNHEWTPEKLAALKEGVAAGLSQRQIAETIGDSVTEEAVRKRIARMRRDGELAP